MDKEEYYQMQDEIKALKEKYKNTFATLLLQEQKLEKIDKQCLLKMNSTPTNFEESAVKVFAHYIYELSTGKTLGEQLKESLENE